jgi:hypothetical protein
MAEGRWLSRIVHGSKMLVPVVTKFVPQLVGWGSALYVAHDVVLWVLQHWGL